MPLNSSVQRLAPEPVQVRGTCASTRLAALPDSPALGHAHVHEALFHQELHRRDDAVLREVLDDHRSGHPTRLLFLVLGGRNASRVRVLTEDRVEPLVVRDVPRGDRLPEQGVGDEESRDAVHHPEFLPFIVGIIDPVVAGFHLRDRFLSRVTVAGVADAGLQEDADEGLLAVARGEGAVEGDLPEESELSGEHPLMFAESRGQVGGDLPHIRGEHRVAGQVRQDVARRHGGLIATAGAGDLGGQVADVGTTGLGDRVAEVQQGVVPIHFTQIGVTLEHRSGVRVQEVHGEHARQHRPALAIQRPLVETHDGQEFGPVDHVEHVFHVDQGDTLIQEGGDGADRDVVRLAVDHQHLAHVDPGLQVAEHAVDHGLALAHRDHHVGVAPQAQEGLALVEAELVLGGLVEVGQGGPAGELAVAGEGLTVPVTIGSTGLQTLEFLIRNMGLGHGSLLEVDAGLHYFSRKVAFDHKRLLDV